MKCIVLFFLSVYLLGTTPLGQLCKLPLLFEHYQEHQLDNKNMSFLGYLRMHYFNGDPKVADYEKDMKLPFKSIEFNNIVSTYIAFEVPLYIIEKLIYTELQVQKYTTSDRCHSNTYLDAIWQPPRVA